MHLAEALQRPAMERRWLRVAVTILIAQPTAHEAMANSPVRDYPFSVTGIRPARADERGFENRHPLLRDPENSWIVPGPAGMRAVVKKDSTRTLSLFLQDSAGGLRRIPGIRSPGPVRWAPGGDRLAVVNWLSRERPWVPVVVTLSPPGIVSPRPEYLGTGLKWSPNGKWVAVDGRNPTAARSFLWLMSSVTGVSRVLDTLSVPSNYEFGWSPDSKWLVVSRPSALSTYEDIDQADLWLISVGGARCRITNSPGVIERNPRWIDGRHIVYRRETTGFTEAPREEVINLRRRGP